MRMHLYVRAAQSEKSFSLERHHCGKWSRAVPIDHFEMEMWNEIVLPFHIIEFFSIIVNTRNTRTKHET